MFDLFIYCSTAVGEKEALLGSGEASASLFVAKEGRAHAVAVGGSGVLKHDQVTVFRAKTFTPGFDPNEPRLSVSSQTNSQAP